MPDQRLEAIIGPLDDVQQELGNKAAALDEWMSQSTAAALAVPSTHFHST